MPEGNEPKKKVLIVEDDVFLSNLLSTRLQRVGIDVMKALDGEEALGILRAGKVDLVLLDIIIPKKSGFEVMEEMQKDEALRLIPVIIVSNLGQEGDIARGKALGAKEYLVKAQNSIDDIVAKVSAFLSA